MQQNCEILLEILSRMKLSKEKKERKNKNTSTDVEAKLLFFTVQM